MNTIGGSDNNLPASERPRSLEAMTRVAPMLASDVIRSSGADEDPRKMTPSRSSNPAAPQTFLQNPVSGTGNKPDRQQRAERQLPRTKWREVEYKVGFDS